MNQPDRSQHSRRPSTPPASPGRKGSSQTGHPNSDESTESKAGRPDRGRRGQKHKHSGSKDVPSPRQKRGPGNKPAAQPQRQSPGRRPPPGPLSFRSLGQGRYVFEAPECALDRDLDLEEVREMIAGGELEIARDELLYLVGDCRGFLEAYLQLAELALEEGDVGLAKGHFGFAYETALEALPQNFKGQIPHAEGYNCHVFAAGRGLARCLIARKEAAKAREVLDQLLRFDATEPESRSLLQQLNQRELNSPTDSK